MGYLQLAQLDPTDTAEALAKDAGAWPAYIAVFLALCLVGLFLILLKVMKDHKADMREIAEGYADKIREIKAADQASRDALASKLDQCHTEHQRQLDQRDERQAQVWEKFTNALQQMRGGP